MDFHAMRETVAHFKRTAMYESHKELAGMLSALLDRLESLEAVVQRMNTPETPTAAIPFGSGLAITRGAGVQAAAPDPAAQES